MHVPIQILGYRFVVLDQVELKKNKNKDEPSEFPCLEFCSPSKIFNKLLWTKELFTL